YDEMTSSEINQVIEGAHRAFLKWRKTSFATRKSLFNKLAGILRDRAAEYAVLMAKEMGKPISKGVLEAEKCAWCCSYYAQMGEKFLEPEMVATDAHKSYITYQPLGVVLAIMPWNFPFWQVIRFAAPSIMAGNVGLLKHAGNVIGCALALENMFKE